MTNITGHVVWHFLNSFDEKSAETVTGYGCGLQSLNVQFLRSLRLGYEWEIVLPCKVKLVLAHYSLVGDVCITTGKSDKITM